MSDCEGLAPYIRYSLADIPPNTPILTLSLELQALQGNKIAKRKSNCGVVFRVHREDDGHDQVCSFFWSGMVDAFGSQGLVLLRHTGDGQYERIDPPFETWRVYDATEPVISPTTQFLRELGPDESTLRWLESFPQTWMDAMTTGGKYEIVWPGGDIRWWAWGSIVENMDRPREVSLRAILPGAPRVTFTVIDEPPAPVYENPRPKWPSVPTPGTPMLTTSLHGPKQKVWNDEYFELTYTVTYNGVRPFDSSGDVQLTTRPIIFDAFYLIVPLEWAFRRRGNQGWELCQDPRVGCAMSSLMYDPDGDVSVNISQDARWISLAPGESWSSSLEANERLPSDQASGDTFRYQLEGQVIKLWNWGSKEDHAQTTLIHRASSGFDAVDWKKRPPIVVPASNSLEFTIE
ncbi:hypothetical protein N7510_011583 [Penicillium lagena]|uniref:uncharacterized protein n=1 Tax=Penicillium lagena TaxID=94218 RepID=UPI0025409326|nr:uncharacterized protein N7510_011583 [Penicillium lagena]KAJ5602049.1 hypothetical protein N7510_011583 [Penicillium lagena]